MAISYEDFNDQQKNASALAIDWFNSHSKGRSIKDHFFLAGYAGTGKTTIARYIADQCGGQKKVSFIAPTGKAASRLRYKGCYNVSTLHQLIYNVRGEDEEGDPIFRSKAELLEKPDLIVCDEGSMVGEWDAHNLMSYGRPILFLGDTGQLRPVKAAQFLVRGCEDVLLDDIERNGGNIVRASMFVRKGARLPIREYDDVKVREGAVPDEVLREHLGNDAVVLCARNDTRILLNKRARALLGFSGPLPNPGEKIVCLFNQHDYGVMNGEQVVVEKYVQLPDHQRPSDDPHGIRVYYTNLTDGKPGRARFNPDSFSSDPEKRREAHRSKGGWDFGSAMTIHKSQGSEWPKVLLIEETLSGCPYAELMYTGITRAIDHLTFYRSAR